MPSDEEDFFARLADTGFGSFEFSQQDLEECDEKVTEFAKKYLPVVSDEDLSETEETVSRFASSLEDAQLKLQLPVSAPLLPLPPPKKQTFFDWLGIKRKEKKKARPISSKATRAHFARHIVACFRDHIFFLANRPTLRHFLEEYKVLASFLKHCVWNMTLPQPNDKVELLPTWNDPEMDALPALYSAQCSSKQFTFGFWQGYAVFIESRRRLVHVMDVCAREDEKSEDSVKLGAAQHFRCAVEVHCLPVLFTGVARAKKRQRKLSDVNKDVLLAIGVTGGSVDLTDDTQRTIWHIIVLFLVMSEKSQGIHDVVDNLRQLDISMAISLLVQTCQSLLYFAHDHKPQLVKTLDPNFDQTEINQIKIVLSDVEKQCNTIPTVSQSVPMPKKKPPKQTVSNAKPIGKFKGNRQDKLLCIVVNGVVGIHATFEQLTRHHILQLLCNACKSSNSSMINYSGLRTRLPHVCPENPKHLFLPHFELQKPYVRTQNPVRCFSPVIRLLREGIKCWEDLMVVTENKCKIEMDILPIPENKHMQLFMEGLQLGPCNLPVNIEHCVHVRSQTLAPIAYFVDKTHRFENVIEKMHELCGGPSANNVFQFMEGPSAENFGLVTYQFSLDLFQGVWQGSRTAGIAVRRTFKAHKQKIVTVQTLSDLTPAASEHYFILRNSPFNPWPSISKNQHVLTIHQLDAAIRKYVQLQMDHIYSSSLKKPNMMTCNENEMWVMMQTHNILICVEDIGLLQVMLLGNVSFVHSFHECDCAAASTQAEWMSNLRTSKHYAAISWNLVLDPLCSFCIQFGNVFYQDISSTAPNQTLSERFKQLVNAADTFVCPVVFVGAVVKKQVNFVDKSNILHESLVEKAHANLRALGATFTKSKDGLLSANLPSDCECCLRKKNGWLGCLFALNAVVFFLSALQPLKSIASDIQMLIDKQIAHPVVPHSVGIRCKHDWSTMQFKLDPITVQKTKEYVDLFITQNGLHPTAQRTLFITISN